MAKLFLSIHVLVAILSIGPVAVAGSMFAPATRRWTADPSDQRNATTLRALYRICNVYSFVAIAVPAFGIVTAQAMGILSQAWLIVSVILTLGAAVVLGVLILPRQRSVIEALDAPDKHDTTTTALSTVGSLAMYTGVFNLLWAIVTVLMIVRPGSTTGA